MDRHAQEVRCVRLERQHVHNVYDRTAHHFKDLHYKAWPKVQYFLQQLEPGAFVADIGCGSGRYLHINPSIFKLGSDHSIGLAEIAKDNGHEVMVCDNLRLPYRDNCFDAIISIAVIHHFSTVKRRIQAVRELARVLRPGGKIMIYVWAMEQKKRQFSAQDVLVPWHFKPKTEQDACDRSRQNGLHTKVSTQGQRHNSNNLLKKIHSSRTGGSLDTATSAQNSILTMKFPWHSKKKATTGSLPDLSQSKDQPHRQPELNRLHMPVQKHRSLSGLLKTRFENLFNNKSQSKQPVSTVTLNKKNCEHTGRMSASFHDLQDKTTGKLKDHVYRQLIEQIMKEDQEIFRLHRPLLEHSLSVPEDDGFAVRQFPQSSQPNLRKQLSLDCDITMVTSQQDISCLSKNSTDVHTAEQINAKLTAANDKCPSSVPLTFTSSESVPCQIREERRDLGPGYQSNKETGRGFNEVCDKPLYKVCDSADITDHWYQQSPVKSQIVGVDSLSPSSSSCLSSSSSSDSEDDWAQTTAQAIKHMQTQLDELNTDNCVQTAGPAGQLADYTALNCNGLTALNNKKLLQQLIEARHRLANTNSPSISDMSSDSTSDDDDDDDAVFQIASICSNDEVDETHKGSLNTPLAMCNGTDSTDETHKGSLTTPLAMCNGTDSTDHQLSQHQAAASLPENIPPKIKNVVEKNTVGATKQGGERCVNTQDDVDHTCQRFYHVFKEQELVELIEKHVDCLHLLESFYDHANWCIIAEKVNVWTI